LTTHEQNRATTKDNLIQAKKILEEQREILQGSNKNVEKVEPHIEDWIKEATIEEELIDDKESEELAKHKRQDE
jgi:hypothetical protein